MNTQINVVHAILFKHFSCIRKNVPCPNADNTLHSGWLGSTTILVNGGLAYRSLEQITPLWRGHILNGQCFTWFPCFMVYDECNT